MGYLSNTKKNMCAKEKNLSKSHSASGCKLIYIFKHSIIVFHFIVIKCLLCHFSLSHSLALLTNSCIFMEPWKLNQVALFNQTLYSKIYFYYSRIVVIKEELLFFCMALSLSLSRWYHHTLRIFSSHFEE